MAKPLRRTQRAGSSALRRHHRARILTSLIAVCQDLERLKVSREARLACREVAGLLDSALAREGAPAGRRK
jgi:hypothetical protein